MIIYEDNKVIINGTPVFIQHDRISTLTDRKVSETIEQFPLGCRVDFWKEIRPNIAGKVCKVVGYLRTGAILVYNPDFTFGHDGGSFFIKNKHLWKDQYTNRCWWVSPDAIERF